MTEEKKSFKRICGTCEFEYESAQRGACNKCAGYDHWTPKLVYFDEMIDQINVELDNLWSSPQNTENYMGHISVMLYELVREQKLNRIQQLKLKRLDKNE
jgi:hypothetical protein